jgi:hypothetical protein
MIGIMHTKKRINYNKGINAKFEAAQSSDVVEG